MQRIARAFAWAMLFALAASFAAQKIRSFDYWWHLRSGQLIVETLSVPDADPFSFSALGTPWLDIHWLHQVGLYGVHQLGGHAGVVAAKVGFIWAVLALLAAIGRSASRTTLSVAALVPVLVLVGDRLMPRPELATFALLSCVLLLLDRFERRGDAWIWAVVPIVLVWANLHALFALGIALCAMHLCAEAARPLLRRGGLRGRRIAVLASVTLAATLVSLINPNGLDGALYPFDQLRQIGLPEQRAALELRSAEISPFWDWQFQSPIAVAVFTALGLASALAMRLNSRRVRPVDWLVWLAFFLLSMAAIRNMALFAIVGAPILVRNLNEWLDVRQGDRSDPAPRSLDAGAAGVLGLILMLLTADVAMGRFYPRMNILREPGFEVLPMFHPEAAVDWIERERPPPPIAHHMADGGYLIWRLYPDYRVLSDGRLDIFVRQPELLRLSDAEAFRAADARYQFGTVLVHYAELGLGEWLQAMWRDPQWRMVFADDVAAVFVRRDRAGAAVLQPPDFDVMAAGVLPPLGASLSYSDARRHLARAALFSALGASWRAEAIRRDAARLYPQWVEAR